MDNNLFLLKACVKQNMEKVKELLALGANPNTQDNAGWTPLVRQNIIIVENIILNAYLA